MNERIMKTSSLLGCACAILLLGMAVGCSKQSPAPAVDEAKPASSAMTEAKDAPQHALPPTNPFLIQDSVYPSVHFDAAQTDTTTFPIWPGSSTIDPSQVQWLPGLNAIGTAHRPYLSGEQAIFFSGGNRAGKIRITGGDFTMIDEVFIPGNEDDTISTTEIRNIVKEMQSAKGDEAKYLASFRTFLEKTAQSSTTIGNGIYTVMDKDGYYYAGWRTSVYKVGDVHPGDVNSPIEISKSYDIRDGLPEDQRDKISRIFDQFSNLANGLARNNNSRHICRASR